MSQLSVYIIAYNEEEKIRAALESVTWADEVIVVDSYSTDKTAEIAKSLGAKVVQEAFKGFGALRNSAIAHCTHDWVFSLDSDERCTEEVKKEIRALLSGAPAADAYYIPRKNIFMGRWIKHSGFYPDYRQPQLFRKAAMVFEDDAVHERYEVVSEKPLAYLTNAIWQMPFLNFSEVLHKANRYSTLGAEKLADQGKVSTMANAFGHGFWTFFQIYFLKRGFLDGWPGFTIALGNFIGTFFKYAKLHEKTHGTKG